MEKDGIVDRGKAERKAKAIQNVIAGIVEVEEPYLDAHSELTKIEDQSYTSSS